MAMLNEKATLFDTPPVLQLRVNCYHDTAGQGRAQIGTQDCQTPDILSPEVQQPQYYQYLGKIKKRHLTRTPGNNCFSESWFQPVVASARVGPSSLPEMH